MLSFLDSVLMFVTNVSMYSFIYLNLIDFCKKAQEQAIYTYVANGHCMSLYYILTVAI